MNRSRRTCCKVRWDLCCVERKISVCASEIVQRMRVVVTMKERSIYEHRKVSAKCDVDLDGEAPGPRRSKASCSRQNPGAGNRSGIVPRCMQGTRLRLR